MTTNLLRKAIVPLAGVAVITLVLLVVAPWAVKPAHAGVAGVSLRPKSTQPFQRTLGAVSGSGVTNPHPSTFTVPDTITVGGHRIPVAYAVIDQPTGQCTKTAGVSVGPTLTSTLDSEGSVLAFAAITSAADPLSVFLHNPGQDFASPGTTVTLSINPGGTLGPGMYATCTVLVPGMLVAEPMPPR